jgi:FemAB-related protein (PEP-CTERM system-associated)
MSNSLKVRKLASQDILAWNRFVSRCPHGTFFHRAEWREVFEGSLGHATHYLFAEAGGEIRGVLPLVHIRSRIFSNVLASLPFLAYGGILAEDTEVASLLESEARAIGEELGVDFIEFRNREKTQKDWPTKPGYVTFRKEMPDTADECMKMIPRKQRAMVRKGIGYGLDSRIEKNLDHFYPVFSESYRNLGTPVLSRKYFDAIKHAFGKDCQLMTIFKDGSPVASVMSCYFRDEVIPLLRWKSVCCTWLDGERFHVLGTDAARS